MAMRKLPSLNALRAFEAAARLSSFTAAAAELHVTQAAVSRSVKLLESQLGLSLFDRHANALALTDSARLLLPELTASFDRVSSAVQRVTGSKSRPILTVGVGPTFAMRWLIPRLARFQAQHPETQINITTGGAAASLHDEWTCRVTLGRSTTAGVTSIPLFSPQYSPVCAPGMAKKLREPRDIYRATLLDVGHAPRDWSLWLTKAGLDETRISNRIVFGLYAFAIQAALDGVGIAIGLHPYIVDDLAAGRLVAPFALSVRKEQGWYLQFGNVAKNQPDFVAFMRWLRKEARVETERESP